MAEVDGKVVMQSKDGHLYQVAPEDVPTVARDQGWSVAGDEAVQKRLEERAQYAQYGSTGQQALAAAETAVRTATLGAVPGFGSPEAIQGRQETLAEESPVTNFLAQAAGAAAPAIATGGALGALGVGGAGAGLAARGAVAAAEGLAGGHAAETEAARQEKRNYSVGNVLMFGVGGEIVGRAVPALIRSGAGALRSRLGSAAAEAGEGVLSGAERRALEASADVADGVPVGPDRDVFLSNAGPQVIDRAAQRGSQALDQLAADVAETTGPSVKRGKVKTLMAKTNEAQRDWAASQSQSALDFRNEINPRPGKKPVPEAPINPAAPLPEGAPLPETGAAPAGRKYSDTPELKRPLKAIDKALTRGSKELDEASEALDWHEAAGRLESDLAAQDAKLQKLARQGVEGAEELRVKVGEYRSKLRMDRERGDLWGQAGDYQASVNKALDDHWRPGAREVEGAFGRQMEDGSVRFDPGKFRSHLSADEVGRGLMPEQLERQLQGAEQLIATHRQYGTASKEQLSRMQSAVDSVREQLRLSDDVRGARARVKEREGVARESAKFDREQAGALREERASAAAQAAREDAKSEAMSSLLGMAVGAAADSFGLGVAVTAGTKLLRMSRLLETLGRTGEATVNSAARGAVLGHAGKALRAIEGGAGAAGKAARPVVQTAMARFQGEYPSVQSAFESKRRSLDGLMKDPIVLHRAVAQHLGPMSKVAPEVYGQVSARLQAAAQYLHENLPTQMSASMVRPNGIPLSRATARDFALKWNSAMDPASVFEDVKNGMASPTQIRTLQTVHPDLYQSLRMALVRQVSESPESLTTQKKLRLDILFGGDGLAGRAYSWPMARAIAAYDDQRRAAGGSGSMPPSGQAKAAPSRGLNKISSSVSNAA